MQHVYIAINSHRSIWIWIWIWLQQGIRIIVKLWTLAPYHKQRCMKESVRQQRRVPIFRFSRILDHRQVTTITRTTTTSSSSRSSCGNLKLSALVFKILILINEQHFLLPSFFSCSISQLNPWQLCENGEKAPVRLQNDLFYSIVLNTSFLLHHSSLQ